MAKFNNPTYNVNLTPNNDTYKENPNGANIPQASLISLYDAFTIPNWGLEDFVKERMKFRQQGLDPDIVSPTSDPGTYFFKLFFDFNTGYGLLGDLISESGEENVRGYKDINTAYQYLKNNSASDRFSSSYKLKLLNKALYLKQFGKLLNYITHNCPWFFKSVDGLGDVLKYNFNDICPIDKRSFTISFNQDAIDMRISTLFDLYKQACFDYTNFKEIIPENLRKFDMCIIMFNTPISGVNTLDDIANNMTHYGILAPGLKTINDLNMFADANSANSVFGLTYKCIYLKNCEIDISNLNQFPESVNTAEGVQNELSMTINFERFYTHTVNQELLTRISEFGLFANTNPEPID